MGGDGGKGGLTRMRWESGFSLEVMWSAMVLEVVVGVSCGKLRSFEFGECTVGACLGLEFS